MKIRAGPKSGSSARGVNDWGFVYPENVSPDGGTVFIGIEGVVL